MTKPDSENSTNWKNQKLITPNTFTEERNALIALKQDQSIHIANADKDNMTIVLNR